MQLQSAVPVVGTALQLGESIAPEHSLLVEVAEDEPVVPVEDQTALSPGPFYDESFVLRERARIKPRSDSDGAVRSNLRLFWRCTSRPQHARRLLCEGVLASSPPTSISNPDRRFV